MQRVLKVTQDDWEHFVKVVRSLQERGVTITVSLARGVREDLQREEEGGSLVAKRILDASSDRGFQDAVKAVLKQEVGTIAVGTNGGVTVVSVPTVYATRRRDPETGELLRQSELWRWFELSWDDFETLVYGLLAQGRLLAERAEALRSVLPLRELYPDSVSPLDAMEQAGIDPQAFKFATDA